MKSAFLNRFLMTLVTYSDSRRFFQCKSHHFFGTIFEQAKSRKYQGVTKVNGRRIRYATVVSNLRLYQIITDESFVI